MDLSSMYHPEIPGFLAGCLQAPELQRLKDVGMNCGCEYTDFPRFRKLAPYSRYTHSLGCSLLVWHFTGSRTQALAALFHDIATPAFAHVVDFLNGDHLTQESTEAGTERIIRESAVLQEQLRGLGIATEDVRDYHRYPIADNDSPRLSADRLEYTLGNLENYGFCTRERLRCYYEDLRVVENEEGQPELGFASLDVARDFGMAALRCARIYIADEDRYAMQRLADLLREAIALGVLTLADLYTTEERVIGLLTDRPETRCLWEAYRRLHRMLPPPTPEAGCIVPAKKRCIDPFTAEGGRLSRVDPAFRQALEDFRSTPLDRPLYGE